jgi:hypothetical protein
MSLSSEEIGEVVADALQLRHFFVSEGASLAAEEPRHEEIPWEIFQGRLLDQTQTRVTRSFLAWSLSWTDQTGTSEQPLLSVKLDPETRQLHVVRALHCYVCEAYDSGGGVILTRETTRWVRELVGSIDTEKITSEDLRQALALVLGQAVVGTSRLPLTSVEAPLPAYSLGRLAYSYQKGSQQACAARAPVEFLRRAFRNCARTGSARILEAALRAAAGAEVKEVAAYFAGPVALPDMPGLLRTLFNEVALSPWTSFVDHVLDFIRQLVLRGCLWLDEAADFLGWLLRHLGRHLTAYDLVTFHHRGANFPDALLLDAVLKCYCGLIEQAPSLFLDEAADGEPVRQRKRRRRRGLRQGWLLRRLYEGLPVPDAPTSPGENARVLPPPYVRVPEEQILQPGKRRRRLFAGDPLDPFLGDGARLVLRQSIHDLDQAEELRELGMAVFIDRPLGVFKAPAEPDQTLLLSHEAFSRSIAAGRLRWLVEGEALDRLRTALNALAATGLPLSAVQCEQRRLVSLADVARAAPDFLLLRTTTQAVTDFLQQYDFSPLAERFPLDYLSSALLVPAPCPPGAQARVLAVYDPWMRKRLELGFDRAQGYEAQAGREYPRGGLQILGVWAAGSDSVLRAYDLRAERIMLRPAARAG